jgi:uncharacterized protein YndB with AHSA1/START domain
MTQQPADLFEYSTSFPCSTEDAFDAWTIPEIMKTWMFSGTNNDIVQVIADPVPNGEFCILKHDPVQELVDYCGHYNEVSRPTLLSFSLESPLRFTGISSVVIRFASVEEGCRIDFLQTGIDPITAQPIWESMFANLANIFAH